MIAEPSRLAAQALREIAGQARTTEVRDLLLREAAKLEPPSPPEPVCSRCGMPEFESEWGRLLDVRVVVAEGEEGFADLTQLLCDKHAGEAIDALRRLGFRDHRHGGTNLLEDRACPGAQGRECDDLHTEADEDGGWYDPHVQSIVLGQPR